MLYLISSAYYRRSAGTRRGRSANHKENSLPSTALLLVLQRNSWSWPVKQQTHAWWMQGYSNYRQECIRVGIPIDFPCRSRWSHNQFTEGDASQTEGQYRDCFKCPWSCSDVAVSKKEPHAIQKDQQNQAKTKQKSQIYKSKKQVQFWSFVGVTSPELSWGCQFFYYTNTDAYAWIHISIQACVSYSKCASSSDFQGNKESCISTEVEHIKTTRPMPNVPKEAMEVTLIYLLIYC